MRETAPVIYLPPRSPKRVDHIEMIGEPQTAIDMAAHAYDRLPIRLHPA